MSSNDLLTTLSWVFLSIGGVSFWAAWFERDDKMRAISFYLFGFISLFFALVFNQGGIR